MKITKRIRRSANQLAGLSMRNDPTEKTTGLPLTCMRLARRRPHHPPGRQGLEGQEDLSDRWAILKSALVFALRMGGDRRSVTWRPSQKRLSGCRHKARGFDARPDCRASMTSATLQPGP